MDGKNTYNSSCFPYIIAIYPIIYSVMFIIPIIRPYIQRIERVLTSLHATIVYAFAVYYCYKNSLLVSYYADISYIRYQNDDLMIIVLDFVISYLLGNYIYLLNCKVIDIPILSHHLIGIISYSAIRITGYGYFFAICFMLTELTVPFSIISRYKYRKDGTTGIWGILFVTTYFITRIMPIPYFVFLICQIAKHMTENIPMSIIAFVSIPSISSINLVWFFLIVRKIGIISIKINAFLFFIYLLYVSWILTLE